MLSTIHRVKTQSNKNQIPQPIIKPSIIKPNHNTMKIEKPIEIDSKIAISQISEDIELVEKDTRHILYEAADKALINIKSANILPTEENYYIFLIKEIDKIQIHRKREILKELENHKHSDEDFKTDLINLERDFKKSFSLFSTILTTTNELYTISKAFKKEFLLLSNEISNANNESKNSAFLIHLNKIDLLLSKYNKILDTTYSNIKTNFDKTIETLNNIKNKSIFNTYFGIYNIKQWFKNIQLFQKTLTINEPKEDNVILLIKPNIYVHSTKENLPPQQQMYIYKILNGIIKKSTRKFDLISIYENSVFVVYLKYTDTNEATKVIRRIDELLNNSFISLDALSTLNIKLEIRKIVVDITQSVESHIKEPLSELTIK